MNHEQLSVSGRNPQEFQRLFTRVENQERLLCDIRKHATDKQKRLVKDMMRDLFQKGVSSDDDEELMKELQKECRTMLDDLRQQQAAYRAEPYLPGKSTVEAGITLMNALINPITTDAFYTALENAQGDYSDFKETYEYLRDFFEGGQIKVFRDAHDDVELYKRNQSQIHDDTVKNVAESMRKILSMAEPYEKIRNLAALHTDFNDKFLSLVEKEAAPVKEYIEGCYNRVFQQLNTVRCKDHFWSAVVAERDDAVYKVEQSERSDPDEVQCKPDQDPLDQHHRPVRSSASARGTGSGCSSGWRLCACKGCHSRPGAPPCDREHSGCYPGLVADQ